VTSVTVPHKLLVVMSARALLLGATCCCLMPGASGGRCGAFSAPRSMPEHLASPAQRPGGLGLLRMRGGGVNGVDGRYLHGGEDRYLAASTPSPPRHCSACPRPGAASFILRLLRSL